MHSQTARRRWNLRDTQTARHNLRDMQTARERFIHLCWIIYILLCSPSRCNQSLFLSGLLVGLDWLQKDGVHRSIYINTHANCNTHASTLTGDCVRRLHVQGIGCKRKRIVAEWTTQRIAHIETSHTCCNNRFSPLICWRSPPNLAVTFDLMTGHWTANLPHPSALRCLIRLSSA